jgi:TusA-related sulfurtransferase
MILADSVADPGQDPPVRLDLRGTPCPLNYVRSRLALEKLPRGASLLVDLDAGEPERMVAEGLRGEGHGVETEPLVGGQVRLHIRRG